MFVWNPMAAANARMSWKILHTTKLPGSFQKSALLEPSDPWEGALEKRLISFYQSYSHTCYRQHCHIFTCCDSHTNHWLSSTVANFCISFITFAVSLRYYYDKKQIAKSVEAFKLALDINPMYEGIWFTLGLGIGWVGLWIARRSQPVEHHHIISHHSGLFGSKGTPWWK